MDGSHSPIRFATSTSPLTHSVEMTFSTSSSAIAPLEETDEKNIVEQQQSPQMLQKVWTISSAEELQALHVQVPGVVFVDYDPELNPVDGSPASPSPTVSVPADDEVCLSTRVSDLSRIVAKIVVTSDSRDLIDVFEVVPLDGKKEGKGVAYRAKHHNADTQGTMLTQIFVSQKAALRDFEGELSEFVIGENVVTQNDLEADVKLSAFNTGSMYFNSIEGFDVRSFNAVLVWGGSFELQVPSIRASKNAFFSAFEEKGTLAVKTNNISASKGISFMPMLSGTLLVESPNLTTDMLMIGGGIDGSVTFTGYGSAKKQIVFLAGSCEVDTSDIVAEKTDVCAMWSSGNIVVQAIDEINATGFGWGTPSIAYVRNPPKIVTEKNYLRWNKIRVQQAMPTEDHIPLEPYKFREPPLRAPKWAHIRVTKPSFFSWSRKLVVEQVDDTSSPSSAQPARGVSRPVLLAGVATVAAITVLAFRQRRK